MINKTTFYPVYDLILNEELKTLGVDPFHSTAASARRNIYAKWTGEIRCPLKGEWFLSGAIVVAYRAGSNNYTDKYPIARLVMTKTVTLRTEISQTHLSNQVYLPPK